MLTAYYADIVRNYNDIIRNYLLSLLFVTRTTMVAGTEILKSGDRTNLDKKFWSRSRLSSEVFGFGFGFSLETRRHGSVSKPESWSRL